MAENHETRPNEDEIKNVAAALEAEDDQLSDSQGEDEDQAALEARIAELEKQLKAEQAQTAHAARFVPNHEHQVQVIRFLQANGITLLIVAWLAMIFGWVLLLAYMVVCYFYPLATNAKRFKWEAAMDRWLTDPQARQDQNQVQLNRLKHMANGIANQTSKVSQNVAQKAEKTGDLLLKQRPQRATSISQHHRLFSNNAEIWFGLVIGIVGFFAAQNVGDGTTDIMTQLQSVIQNGGLSSDGYFLIWGYVGARLGIMMFVGGLVKGFLHKANNGVTMKALAVLAAVALAGIATYTYMNPAEAAMNAVKAAYQSGASLSDLGNLAGMMSYVPWVVMGIYALGILINLFGRSEEA